MVNQCWYCHASSNDKTLTFHKFPHKNPEQLRTWLAKIPSSWQQPKNHHVLCSKHFTPDCFDKAGAIVRLKDNKVPTLFDETESMCVYCKKRKTINSEVSFFHFPLNEPDLLKQWCKNIGKENWQPSQKTYLCSNHFEPSCLKICNDNKYWRLKKGSVPTLFSENNARFKDAAPLPLQCKNNSILNRQKVIDNTKRNKISLSSRKLSEENVSALKMCPMARLNSNSNENEVEQQHISPTDDAVVREPSPFLNDSEKSLSEENHSLSENDQVNIRSPEKKKIRLAVNHDHQYLRSPRKAHKMLLEMEKRNQNLRSQLKIEKKKPNGCKLK